jgi:hypothetical protein
LASGTSCALSTFSGTGLINRERPAFIVLAIQRLYGLQCLGVIGHLYKTESARTASFAISYDLGLSDRAVRLEKCQQIIGCAFPRQIANVKLLAH